MKIEQMTLGDLIRGSFFEKKIEKALLQADFFKKSGGIYFVKTTQKSSETTMVSELFFYFADEIIRADFERNPLTHTLTHTPIAYSGQGSTKRYLLAPKLEKAEKLLKFSL